MRGNKFTAAVLKVELPVSLSQDEAKLFLAIKTFEVGQRRAATGSPGASGGPDSGPDALPDGRPTDRSSDLAAQSLCVCEMVPALLALRV